MTPYYHEDGITIYHGDCREYDSVVDVLITDPPYGVSLGATGGRSNGHGLQREAYASFNDSPESYRNEIAPHLSMLISQAIRAAVFAYRLWELPAWDVLGGVYLPAGCGRSKWGFTCLAPVVFYGVAPDLEKGARPTVFVSSDIAPSNGHPCPKPESWMRWLVGFASRPGETILDPFAGSGTTLVAAKRLGRQAVGIEIEERYCEIAAERLAQGALFRGEDIA